MKPVPIVIQETQEGLAVIGGTIKRLQRKLLALQGEAEKAMNDFEKMITFIEKREKQIKKLIEEGVKDET